MTTEPVTAVTTTSALLREATADVHREAEDRDFMVRLMRGELDLAAYVAYLAQYARIYRALETVRPTTAVLPWMLDDRALDRAPSIEADLTTLGAPDWEGRHPVLPATAAYVARLEALDPDDVARRLAHHYTRYLGDLSGGQVIAVMLARHYGATPEQLSFYRFDGIPAAVPYKRRYRAGLDDVALSRTERDALVAEARLAFQLNTAVFDALGAARASEAVLRTPLGSRSDGFPPADLI